MKTEKAALFVVGFIFFTKALPSQAGVFNDTLANGLNTNYWLSSQTTSGLYSFDDAHGSFALAKTTMPSPGGFQNEKLTLNLANLGGNISGDFSTKVSFSNAVLPNPKSGWNQVQFELYFQDGSFAILRRSTNPDVIDL